MILLSSTAASDGTSCSASIPFNGGVPVDTELHSTEISKIGALTSLRSTDENSASLIGYCYYD